MGALSKLTRPQIIIIAAVLTVLAAALIGFLLIKPQYEALEAANQRYEQRQAVAVQRPQAEKELEDAKREAAQARAQWARYVNQFMPDINRSNLLRGMQQRWQEQSNVLGPMTERFLRADNRVRIVQAGLSVPAPPTDPNAINTEWVVLPLGNVSVMGSFRNVLSHAERWNQFKRLVLVDNLTLSGNSPQLVGQYSLTAFIYTQGEPGPAIPVPAGGGAGGGRGIPGMPGMSGPMPGMGGPGGSPYGPMPPPGAMSGPPSGAMSGPPPGAMSGPPMRPAQ